MRQFDIVSYDGLRLSAFDWPSYGHPNDPNVVIILLHGLAEYSGRYVDFAHFYNENDVAVVSMDLRGHGLSEGEHIPIPSIETMFEDIDCLIEETRHRYPHCPAILYGHSMGGNLALSYTLNRYPKKSDECPYQAMIVSSPWIRLAGRLQPPRPLNSLIQKIGRFHPSFKVRLRFNPRILSRNQDIVNAYAVDPQIRRSATLSLIRTMGSTATMLDRAVCTYHIPVLLQHGAGDCLTSHDASLRFAQRGKNIQFKSWPNCYHELHHEPEWQIILISTLNWIYDRAFS